MVIPAAVVAVAVALFKFTSLYDQDSEQSKLASSRVFWYNKFIIFPEGVTGGFSAIIPSKRAIFYCLYRTTSSGTILNGETHVNGWHKFVQLHLHGSFYLK